MVLCKTRHLQKVSLVSNLRNLLPIGGRQSVEQRQLACSHGNRPSQRLTQVSPPANSRLDRDLIGLGLRRIMHWRLGIPRRQASEGCGEGVNVGVAQPWPSSTVPTPPGLGGTHQPTPLESFQRTFKPRRVLSARQRKPDDSFQNRHRGRLWCCVFVVVARALKGTLSIVHFNGTSGPFVPSPACHASAAPQRIPPVATQTSADIW
jgi:hypothetical protein